MWLVNQEVLSEKNNPALWKWYQGKLQEIRNLKKEYFRFDTRNRPVNIQTDKGYNLKVKKIKILPIIASAYYNEEFKDFQTWEYAPTANSIKNDRGYATIINSRGFMFNAETVLNVTADIELVFFLLYVSDYLTKGVLFHIDNDKINKEKSDQNAQKFEVGYLISSPSSPIAPEKLGSEELFRTLCVAWGVQEVSGKPIYQLKNELLDVVTISQNNLSQTNRGYDQFIKECYSYGDSELRGNVMLAMEKNLLSYNDLYWKLKCKGGNEMIVETMEKQHLSKAPDILVKKFSDNETLKNLLMEVLGSNVPDLPKKDTKKFQEKRKELQERGYKFEEVRKMKEAQMDEELAKSK